MEDDGLPVLSIYLFVVKTPLEISVIKELGVPLLRSKADYSSEWIKNQKPEWPSDIFGGTA